MKHRLEVAVWSLLDKSTYKNKKLHFLLSITIERISLFQGKLALNALPVSFEHPASQ